MTTQPTTSKPISVVATPGNIDHHIENSLFLRFFIPGFILYDIGCMMENSKETHLEKSVTHNNPSTARKIMSGICGLLLWSAILLMAFQGITNIGLVLGCYAIILELCVTSRSKVGTLPDSHSKISTEDVIRRLRLEYPYPLVVTNEEVKPLPDEIREEGGDVVGALPVTFVRNEQRTLFTRRTGKKRESRLTAQRTLTDKKAHKQKTKQSDRPVRRSMESAEISLY